MRKKIKNQNGFIQIPLLIIIIVSIVAVSTVTTGVVLYKQGKLSSMLASVSGLFEKPDEENFELNNIQEAKQEAESKEDLSLKGDQISQSEQEIKRLEAETQRIKIEQEEAKKLAGEKVIEEAFLKIEKCKSERSFNEQKLTYKVEVELNNLNDLKRELEEKMYQDCVDNFMASSGINSSSISGQTFSNLANLAKTQCENVIIKARVESQSDFEKLKNQKYLEIEEKLQSQYQDCLNK